MLTKKKRDAPAEKALAARKRVKSATVSDPPRSPSNRHRHGLEADLVALSSCNYSDFGLQEVLAEVNKLAVILKGNTAVARQACPPHIVLQPQIPIHNLLPCSMQDSQWSSAPSSLQRGTSASS